LFHHSASAIYFPASNLADNVPGCSYAKITNSTFHNIIINDYVATIDIQENNNAKETGNTEVEIDHVTIYNFESTAEAAIKVYKSGNTKITNTIVANPAESAMKSFMTYSGSKVQKCLSFNAPGQWIQNVYTDTIQADPLFVDAANGNFMLKYASPAIGVGTDGSNLGDPRWGAEALITLSDGNNSNIIEENASKATNVKIKRTLLANDGYYTICLPFDLDASKIGKAYQIKTITEHVAGEGINVEFTEVTTLTAGQPYLLLPSKNLENPIFEGVTIVNTSGETTDPVVGAGIKITFTGIINGVGETTGSTDYYVGDKGYLYNGTTEKLGLRAFFTITDEAGNPTKVRARVVVGENTTTDLDNILNGENTTIKVIKNGQLIIIRNGEKFNAQGQKL
jgi:hypothetical protein